MPRAIDHLVIPAHDLAAQAELYRRLGFQVGARNRHPWGTENHIVQFDGTLLELIGLGEGFEPPARVPTVFSFARFVAEFLGRREGLAMLVLRARRLMRVRVRPVARRIRWAQTEGRAVPTRDSRAFPHIRFRMARGASELSF